LKRREKALKEEQLKKELDDKVEAKTKTL